MKPGKAAPGLVFAGETTDPSLRLLVMSSTDPWNSRGGGMMTSLVLLPVETKSSSLIGIGGGSSPFADTELSLPSGMLLPARALGVKGDFGVLPPDCEVRGEVGGLSLPASPLPPCAGVCFDFDPSGVGGNVTGEIALSEFGPPEVLAPLFRSRVQVKMSMSISVWRRTLPPENEEN